MKSKYSLSLIALLVLVLPAITFAAFKPLVGIPGVDGNADFNTYINALYALSISIAALLAVIKIIIAGVKWMLSDVVTSKQEAKSDMQGALLGLLIVIAAVVILNTINPQLTQTSIFIGPVDKVPNSAPAVAGGGGGAPGAVLPVTSDCVESIDAGGVRDYDCSAAIAACTASKGRAEPGRNWAGVETSSKITCSYGNRVRTGCTYIGPGNPGEPDVYSCDAAKAACENQKGSATITAGGATLECIIPY